MFYEIEVIHFNFSGEMKKMIPIDVTKIFTDYRQKKIIDELRFIINENNLDFDLGIHDDEIAKYLFKNLVSLYQMLNWDKSLEKKYQKKYYR